MDGSEQVDWGENLVGLVIMFWLLGLGLIIDSFLNAEVKRGLAEDDGGLVRLEDVGTNGWLSRRRYY